MRHSPPHAPHAPAYVDALAIRFHTNGGPEVLRSETVPVPPPGPGPP